MSAPLFAALRSSPQAPWLRRSVLCAAALNVLGTRPLAAQAGVMEEQHVIVGAEKGRHTATVIFMHGLGDTGHGWGDFMDDIKRPHIKYICPTAKHQRVTLNMGMAMPSWFDVFGLGPGAKEDMEGIERAAAAVRTLIAEENEAGIPTERVVVAGFSQGGAVALFTGLTHTERLAGVVGLSTWLFGRERFPELLAESNKNTPTFVGHGMADEVVQHDFGEASAKIIQQAGVPCTFHSYRGLGHGASPQEMADLKSFLDTALPDAKDTASL